MRGHPLCPTTATFLALRLSPDCDPAGPAFPSLKPKSFNNRLKLALKNRNLEQENFASHSLRRGGASFLWKKASASVEDVKYLGNWSSDAYTLYLIQDEKDLKKITDSMATAITAEIPPL